MILPVMLVLLVVAVAGFYAYLRKQGDRRLIWRAALRIGVGFGIARAALASAGWYTVEHTAGPLQVPGYALSMAAFPEAALLDTPRTAAATAGFYLLLSLLLVTSTTVVAAAIAALALANRTGDAERVRS